MLQVALCDDEPSVRKTLISCLTAYSRENHIEITWEEFGDGEALLAASPDRFDLLILDVQMGSTNGIDVARRLRALHIDATIIFFTNFVQYALEGYEVQAFRFILKPLDYAQFSDVVGKAISQIDSEKSNYITVRLRDEIKRLPISELTYIETERGHVILHLRNGEDLTSASTMKELEEALTGHPFFRCHTAYLVNLKDIRTVERQDIRLESNVLLPVSKYRKKELMNALAVYWGEQFL